MRPLRLVERKGDDEGGKERRMKGRKLKEIMNTSIIHHMHTHTRARTHTHTHACTHTHAHTCTHTRTHAQTHTHTHTSSSSVRLVHKGRRAGPRPNAWGPVSEASPFKRVGWLDPRWTHWAGWLLGAVAIRSRCWSPTDTMAAKDRRW